MLTLAFDAPAAPPAAPPAAVPAPPPPPRPPSVDGACSEEESDVVVGVDEVMPAAKPCALVCAIQGDSLRLGMQRCKCGGLSRARDAIKRHHHVHGAK